MSEDDLIIHVQHCARCGGEHWDLVCKSFVQPVVLQDMTFPWWTLCPTSHDPILVGLEHPPQRKVSLKRRIKEVAR